MAVEPLAVAVAVAVARVVHPSATAVAALVTSPASALKEMVVTARVVAAA